MLLLRGFIYLILFCFISVVTTITMSEILFWVYGNPTWREIVGVSVAVLLLSFLLGYVTEK